MDKILIFLFRFKFLFYCNVFFFLSIAWNWVNIELFDIYLKNTHRPTQINQWFRIAYGIIQSHRLQLHFFNLFHNFSIPNNTWWSCIHGGKTISLHQIFRRNPLIVLTYFRIEFGKISINPSKSAFPFISKQRQTSFCSKFRFRFTIFKTNHGKIL